MSRSCARKIACLLVVLPVCGFSAQEAQTDYGHATVQRILALANQGRPKGTQDQTNREVINLFKKIMQFVLANDKGLRMKRCDILADGSVNKARAQFLPTLAGTAKWEYAHNPSHTQPGDENNPDRFDKTNTNGGKVGLELGANLFRSGGSIAALKGATNARKAAFYDYKSDEGAAINEVFTTVLNAIEMMIVIKSNEATIAIYKELLHAALQQLKVGGVDKSEVAQAQRRLAKAEAYAAEHLKKFEGYIGDVERKTGLTRHDLLRVMPDFSAFMPKTLEEAQRLAERGNGHLLACHYKAMAGKAAIHAAQAGYGPTVDASLNFGGSMHSKKTDSKNTAEGSYEDGVQYKTHGGPEFGAGVTLKLPFDTTFTTTTEVKGARMNYIKGAINEAKIRSDLTAEVATLFANLAHAHAAVEAQKRHVEACMIIFQSALQEMTAGAKVYMQVLSAQSDLMDAQDKLVDAQKDLAVIQLALLAAMGELNPERFGIVAFEFDPDKNPYESPMSLEQKQKSKKQKTVQQAPKVVTVKNDVKPAQSKTAKA